MGKLRRQLWLLAGLVLLCFFLPLGAGQAAQHLLSQGVKVGAVTLAVASPEGDSTAALLAQYMGGMEDIAQYCRITAMEENSAIQALEAGEVTAVLSLPEGFIQGVMRGENPDLRLIVAGDQPLESLLLLWVGQSASDLLAAVQSGIYAVLDLYAENPPAGLDYNRVVFDINLRYIALTLDRTSMFRTQEISATEALPIPLHYRLSLVIFFTMSAAPLFVPVYTGGWLGFQRRLRSVGRSSTAGFLSSAAVSTGALLTLLAPSLLLSGTGYPLAIAGTALLAAVFCSLFCALCCLASERAAGCGTAAFTISLISLFLAGGVIPPVLLPGVLRRLSPLSPVTWLRQLTAWPMGYDVSPFTWACLALSAAGMAIGSLILYRRRVCKKGETP